MNELERTLAALAERFRDRCGRDRLELQALIQAGQIGDPRLMQLVHSLVGAGGTFGFQDISDAARRAERTLIAGAPDSQAISDLLEQLARCQRHP